MLGCEGLEPSAKIIPPTCIEAFLANGKISYIRQRTASF